MRRLTFANDFSAAFFKSDKGQRRLTDEHTPAHKPRKPCLHLRCGLVALAASLSLLLKSVNGRHSPTRSKNKTPELRT